MYRLFNNNSLLTFALLPLVLLIYRIRLISNPTLGLAANDPDLYTPLWNMTFGHIPSSSITSVAVALVLTFIAMLVVNNIMASYKLSRNTTFLPAVVFIILSSGFVVGQGLHPVLVFVNFFAIAIHRLFEMSRPDSKPYRYCFEAVIYITVGSLFWTKGLWFVPFIIVAAGMLRALSLRTFSCMLWGLLAPIMIVGSLAYVTDNLQEWASGYEQTLMVPVAFYRTWLYGKTYLFVSGSVLVLSILSAIRNMGSLSIWQSRITRVTIWMILYPALLIILPHFSFEMQVLVAMGGAMTVPLWIQRQRNQRMSELTLSLLAAFTLLMQWNI